jgi:hypothetical protein
LHVLGAEQLPHEPPQPSSPHSRPAQFRVQESTRASIIVTSVGFARHPTKSSEAAHSVVVVQGLDHSTDLRM